jgi:diacylglycerol kinase family enzyme
MEANSMKEPDEHNEVNELSHKNQFEPSSPHNSVLMKNKSISEDELKRMSIKRNLEGQTSNANLALNNIGVNKFQSPDNRDNCSQGTIPEQNIVVSIESNESNMNPNIDIGKIEYKSGESNNRYKDLMKSTAGTTSGSKNFIYVSGENGNDTIMFYFVNKYAGEQKGKCILEMGVKKIEFSNEMKVTAYIYDLSEPEYGIEMLKYEQSRNKLIKVIICSGDGSVLPFIELLHHKDIDIKNLIFCVLPFGRSNDLSRHLGIGDSISISSDMSVFRTLTQTLNDLPSVCIDIWETKIICDSMEGGFNICKSLTDNEKSQKTFLKDSNNKTLTTLRKYFICYCSLGIDARIGYDANKTRSTCKCWNSCMYLWEKVKKCFFRKTISVNGFIDSFYAISSNYYNENNNECNVTKNEDENKKTMIFTTTYKKEKQTQNVCSDLSDECDYTSKDNKNKHLELFKSQQVLLKGDPIGFVCQNIKYFCNGDSNSWGDNNKEYALQFYDPKSQNINDKQQLQAKKNEEQELFKNAFSKGNCSINDEKLEFYAYYSVNDIESANKEKIFHGEGPFVIKFKPTVRYNENDKYNRIYLNIDGEYYNVVKPIEMRIRLCKTINNGKIKFLAKG